MARSAGGRVVENGSEKASAAADSLRERIELRQMSCSPVEAIDKDDLQQIADDLRDAADMIEAGSKAMRR